MPRAKKQTGTAAPAAGVAPPPPVPGGVPGGPPPMPPGGFNPGPAPQPPSPPQGFPGGPPTPPAPGGFPPLGQMQHPVPGASVAPPAPPAPGSFTPPAPQPMVPPQGLPPAPAPAPQGGADLGPVLAKLEDLGASVTKSLAGVDGKIQQAIAAAFQPLATRVEELFSLSQALYNMMLNDGTPEQPAQQEQQQAAPPQQQAPAGGGLDKATADQLVGSLRAYKGYDAGQLAQHFAASYQQQGFPQLTAEVIYNVAGQAGLIGADGKIQ